MSLQFYILPITYLIFSSLLLLVDSYRRGLSFMLKAKSKLKDDEKKRNELFLGGILIALGKLFFPIAPGPIIIGDLLPAAAVLAESFSVRMFYKSSEAEGTASPIVQNKKKSKRLGFIFLSIAVIHFLFPRFVML